MMTAAVVSLLLLTAPPGIEDNQARAGGATLGLTDALGLALTHHPALAAARTRADAAALLPQSTLGFAVPQVFASTGASMHRDPLFGSFFSVLVPQSTLLRQSVFGTAGIQGRSPIGTDYRLSFRQDVGATNDYLSPLSPSFQPTVRLELSQPLMRGMWPGWLFAPYREREAQAEAASAEVGVTERALLLVAARAWFQAVRAAAIFELQQTSLAFGKDFEQLTKKLIRGGQQSRLDLALARQTVGQRAASAEAARTEAIRARLRLSRALALPDDVSFDELPSLASVSKWLPEGLDAEAVLARVLERDPELERLRAEESGRRIASDRLVQSMWPDVRLKLDAYSSGLAGVSHCRGGYLADGVTPCGVDPSYRGGPQDAALGLVTGQLFGVNASIEGTFDTWWGPARASSESMAMQAQGIEEQARARRATLRWDVRRLLFDLDARRQVMEQMEGTVSLAQEALDAEDVKLRAGRSTGFDVLRAQQLLIGAQLSLVEARTQYGLAIAELYNLLGELTPTNAQLKSFGARTVAVPSVEDASAPVAADMAKDDRDDVDDGADDGADDGDDGDEP